MPAAKDGIIDADGHVVEPRAVWQEYTEPAYREQVIQIRRNREGRDELWIGGENRSRPSLAVAAGSATGWIAWILTMRR